MNETCGTANLCLCLVYKQLQCLAHMRLIFENLSPDEVRERTARFRRRHVRDWKDWLPISTCLDAAPEPIEIRVAEKLGGILWNWRACGRSQLLLEPHTLLETLNRAHACLYVLGNSDLRSFLFPTPLLRELIRSLWIIFRNGLCKKGKAGEVAITKAILLTTRGRIGPAFDSNVQRATGIIHIPDSENFVSVLSSLAKQLIAFEDQYRVRIEDLVPVDRGPVAIGRAIDMLLGPKEKD